MRKILKSMPIFALMFAIVVCSALFVGCGKDKEKVELVTKTVSSYVELKDAAVNSNCDIIKLTADIDVKTDDMPSDEYFVFKRKVTLDLNGKTIKNTETVWNNTTHVHALIEIGAGAEVTIRGNGKVESKAGDAYAISVANGGKVTIENGEFVGNITTVYVLKGTAEIKGGVYSINQLDPDNILDPGTGISGYGYVINCFDENYNSEDSKVVISGGEFVKFNPADNVAEGEHTNFVKEGYKAVLKTGSENVYEVVAK